MGIGNGLGAFVQGAFQGYGAGRTIRKDIEEQQLKDEIDTAQQDVRVQRSKAIDASVQQQPDVQQMGEDGTPGAVTPGGFAVKGLPGKKYASLDEAGAAAERTQPGVDLLFAQKAAPILANHYLKQGNVQAAQAATEWAKGVKGQAYLGASGKVLAGLQAGDEGLVNEGFMSLHSVHGDGTEFMGAKLDGEGNVAVQYRAPGSEEVQNQTMSRDQAVKTFLSMYSPEAGFKMHLDEIAAERKAKQEKGQKLFEHGLNLQLEGAKTITRGKEKEVEHQYRLKEKGVEHGYRVGEKQVEHQRNVERDDMREAARFKREKALKDYDAANPKPGKEGKDGTEGNVAKAAGAAQKWIGADYDDQIESLEAQAALSDKPEQIQAQVATLKQEKAAVSSAAGEVVSFTKRLAENNPALKDLTPPDLHVIGKALVEARAGRGNQVGIAIDKKTGQAVEVFKDPSRGVIPVTAPRPLDPNNPTHAKAIIAAGNKRGDGTPLIDPALFAKLTQKQAAPAAGKPAGPAGGLAPLYPPKK